ncbi:hypothetical protein DVH24_002099 [Malus domestica]|uniref:Uncharacterized protein n=1 Tax=Malus domestica TaxID=3750 RepID=A0A498IAL1_MALDO|nr:hypothetical protein DVH24_002099 [Malus domestica]
MTTQANNNESFRAYLKRFYAKLAEIEKPNDRLATMGFKQGLYLNKKKYDMPSWQSALMPLKTSSIGMIKLRRKAPT